MAQQRFDKDRKKSFGGYGKPKGDYKRPYGGSPRNERSDYDRDERPADFADSDEVTGLIVGRNPVMEALKSGKALDTIYVNENAGGSIGAITRIARERGIVIKNVSDQKLTQMCGGASHLAPENTLTAFRLAKTLGADGFECDVQITRDRHLVVAHDYLTDLKTGVHGNIPDMDFDDLRQLDFGKWKSPEFAGEKIPTLEEVLEVAQDFRMIHIELKPYFDRDEEIVDRVIDAVLDAGLEEKAVLTSFEYGTLRRVKERMPQMATCAMTLSPESQLSQPATFWEKLGLKKTDPLVEKLSSPQALSEAAALLEDPSSLDEENSVLIYYLKDRLDFLYSIFPGMNLAEILQQYYYQTDFVNYVAQFGFPVDYVGPEYHAFFRDKDLIPNAHAHGFKVAPWPVGVESRDDLRQLFRLDPELVVTNKPEVAVAILTGLGQWDESSKEG